MRNTLISLIAITAMASATGYNFASVQKVDEVNATVQTATEDVTLTGSTLTVKKINDATSTIDLATITPAEAFNNAEFDGATKKITFTMGDGTTKEIDLSGAGTNVNLSGVTYDRPDQKLTFTLTNGTSILVEVPVDKADIGLGDVNNTKDEDKPVSTATQAAIDAVSSSTTALESRIRALENQIHVDKLELNGDSEIVYTLSDGTELTL